jgi:hypothetical protein
MRTIRQRSLAIVCLLLGASATGFADTPVDTQCKVEKKPADAVYFPEMAAADIEVRRSVCISGADEQDLVIAMVSFVESEAKQERLRPYGFTADNNPLQTALAGINPATGTFPGLAIARPGVDAIDVGGAPVAPADASVCRQAAEKVKADSSCRKALNEFSQIYTYAHRMVEERGAIAFSNRVADLTQEWDDFLKYAHGQTLLELTLNGYLYRKHERPVFTSPPDRQIILLHPNFVVENVDAALEGDQTKEALMIEVIGMNWWRERPWYIPSGGSLVGLYSDRVGVSDVGYGLAIHFKGVYTLGYALHDSDGGVFISVDLLKLFQDKKRIIEKYQP